MILKRATEDRRCVIVHYHLFKNGGTSVERILHDSFGSAWASFDKAEAGAKISGAEMQAFIDQHPNVKAVSSHQIVPPAPTGNFDVIPVVFLREPLARVRSAYLFEWQKQLGLAEPKGSLASYIEQKFEQKNTSVIANFQVARLSNANYDDVRQKQNRYHTPLLFAAMRFVDSLPFIGLVERFADSLELMQAVTKTRFPDLVVREHRENVLQSTSQSHEDRLEELRKDIGNDLFDELCVRNRFDLQLYSYASGRFEAALELFRR